jgi:DNA adenine methylase
MIRYRTPLRYPGGKQKLTPFINEILETNDLIDGQYVEPYAGGAGVAIELLLSGRVKRVILNDASFAVYAFWRSIVDEPEKFCRKISAASLTIPEWRRQKEIMLNPEGASLLDLGFSLFFMNRCNRSGIPTAGVIGGYAQTGQWKIDARFTKKELIKRVEAIAEHSDKFVLSCMDAEKFILQKVNKLTGKTLVYLDPPYFEKSPRLYLNSYVPEDHTRIAKLIRKELKQNWIVSYDNAPQILKAYAGEKSFVYDLQYNAGKVRLGKELFVFSKSLKIPSGSKIPTIDEALSSLALAS